LLVLAALSEKSRVGKASAVTRVGKEAKNGSGHSVPSCSSEISNFSRLVRSLGRQSHNLSAMIHMQRLERDLNVHDSYTVKAGKLTFRTGDARFAHDCKRAKETGGVLTVHLVAAEPMQAWSQMQSRSICSTCLFEGGHLTRESRQKCTCMPGVAPGNRRHRLPLLWNHPSECTRRRDLSALLASGTGTGCD